MYEKFTERARKVMNIARAEAQRVNSEFIGTEHMLLGIVHQDGGVAAKVLKNLRIDFHRVRKELERLLQPNPTPTVTLGHLPFSPRAKRVLELAQESATRLGHDVIGSEHLLLGLLKENEGIAAMVLQNLGARLNEVHDMVMELLGPPQPSEGEDLLAKVRGIFRGPKMPPAQPPKDSIGGLRESVDALDTLVGHLIGELDQLESSANNPTAKEELADLRTRFKELMEQWRERF